MLFLREIRETSIIREFNNISINYQVNQTLHKLFEEQVEQTPNQIAVVYDKIQLTYQELNEKANQLGFCKV